MTSEAVLWTSGIMAFLHHLAAFTLTGVIIYEHITFRKDLSLAEARRIQIMDILYGVSAGVLVVVGLLRVFYFEKGAAFYAQNWFFWTKMLGFVLAGAFSIYPTIRFLSEPGPGDLRRGGRAHQIDPASGNACDCHYYFLRGDDGARGRDDVRVTSWLFCLTCRQAKCSRPKKTVRPLRRYRLT